MPAGPAPTTATRSGWFPEGAEAAPSSDTTSILTPRGTRAPAQRARIVPASAAGVVVVKPRDDELAERHPTPRDERGGVAGGHGPGQGSRPGQPVRAPGEVAVRPHGSRDPRPLVP